jgi:hypothetical protein
MLILREKRVNPIAYTEMTAGTVRPVFVDNSRQFVIDDDGERHYGD